MDYLMVRSFIKELIYDLETVRYLLDYNRLKETLPIIDKILGNITTFRAQDPADGSNKIFPLEFWNKKLPAAMSFDDLHSLISKFAHSKSLITDEQLDKIEYKAFIQNVFRWTNDNIHKLRQIVKSPFRTWLEKRRRVLIGSFAGLLIVIGVAVSGWLWHTSDWGLKGDFYRGQKFEQYIYSGNKKTIDFSEPQEMDTRLPNDDFSDRWYGSLLAPRSGEYSIFVYGDDGVKLFIDGKLLLTGTWYGGEVTTDISLTQGPHSILLEHFQAGGPAALKLYWSMPGGKKEIVGAKYLRH